MAEASVNADVVNAPVALSTKQTFEAIPAAVIDFYRKHIPDVLRPTFRSELKIPVPGLATIALFLETHLHAVLLKSKEGTECIKLVYCPQAVIFELCKEPSGDLIEKILLYLENYFEMQSLLDAVDIELPKILEQYQIKPKKLKPAKKAKLNNLQRSLPLLMMRWFSTAEENSQALPLLELSLKPFQLLTPLPCSLGKTWKLQFLTLPMFLNLQILTILLFSRLLTVPLHLLISVYLSTLK